MFDRYLQSFHIFSPYSVLSSSNYSCSISLSSRSKSKPRPNFSVLVSTVFLLVSSLSSFAVRGADASDDVEELCQQLGPCKCRMANETGEINLKNVAFFNGKPRFVIALNESFSVAYNPCVGFTLAPGPDVSDKCKDAAVCVFKVSDKNTFYRNRGQSKSAKFQFDQESSKFFISYTSPDQLFKTHVYLQCSPVDQLSVIKSREANQSLSLLLQSVCACPGGCTTPHNSFSPGSYIVIVFFSILFIYLSLGVLYKRIVYSAEGTELVPNREGWASFFTLVKDGYLFFISPCLGNTIDYRYYQRL
ncbi:uncharacterized protein LOC106870323 [Octopus bimaculoides]|uniref:Uncharacterized protein n=1 Tax=Octopus bimaculoides TaxID=37653 RepID=A0A0L8HJF5_OCTBM|nr:uncharacterized protein LOC106870323 [Octopus bimaculoides]XP_052831798.1 uncharacterized protein LOC106870323 [Octopus bimaculoides]|eukprot:XP_014771832.1 PREDICTED: uncharacterized protein LOC106870323 [Octopus bimaculoides]